MARKREHPLKLGYDAESVEMRRRENVGGNLWKEGERQLRCLRCRAWFMSAGKLNRICERCRRENEGMSGLLSMMLGSTPDQDGSNLTPYDEQEVLDGNDDGQAQD